MRFLIDANLPRAVIAVVQRLGHQAEFARDVGLASATDEQIAKQHCESSENGRGELWSVEHGIASD
jgi:predicted nuclease of predicted toxin-antitoxin system